MPVSERDTKIYSDRKGGGVKRRWRRRKGEGKSQR